MKRADVAIVGGGPAGLAAALTLTAFTPATVVLHDRAPPPRARAGETLAPGAIAMLRWLGAEGALEDAARPCVARRAAWGGGPPRSHEHLFDAQGEGVLLDRDRFETGLTEALVQRGTCLLKREAVDRVTDGGGQWRLERSGTTLTAARFVIDASGRSARVARSLGARRQRTDRLVGLVGRIADHEATSATEDLLLEAVPNGWWYAGQLPNGAQVAALMTDADIARHAGLLTAAGWNDALASTAHVGHRVRGRLKRPPEVHPAETSVLDRAAGPGWVAAGDAAVCMDPLSGMGLGQALASGIHAARVAAEQLEGDDRRLTAAYAAGIEAHYAECLRRRAGFYALERRWTGSSFWQRRHAGRA